jgi:hypothetical protein
VTDCSRPVDALDIEALASGEAPSVQADAGAHASQCVSCGQRVQAARQLEALLMDSASEPAAPADLADRVLRVRPFSRAERWSLAVWKAPLLLLAGLVGSGSRWSPGSPGRGTALGLAAALVASMAGLLRAASRWLLDLSRSAPAGSRRSRSCWRRRPPAGRRSCCFCPPASRSPGSTRGPSREVG